MKEENTVIKKQSDFFQTKKNEAELGAYYTDWDHCRWISNFLEFPKEEVCCIEPSIGDAKAVLTVTGKEQAGSIIRIFGVELNDESAADVKQNPLIDQCLQADFLTDVMITQQSFSFAFVNPPYGTMGEDRRRYETEFLQKLSPYLTKGAVVVFILPQYVLEEADFPNLWCSLYETKQAYRFHRREYEKYKQIVLFGIKKQKMEPDKEARKRMQQTAAQPDGFPELPEQYNGVKIQVPKSSEKNLYQFMTREFQPELAKACVLKSNLNQMVMEKIRVPKYQINNLGRPPILPSDGQMYLLAVSGAGQGLVGSEENQDLHLQRGVARTVTSSSYMTDEEGTMKELVTSYPQIQYNLIEGDGTIRTLK